MLRTFAFAAIVGVIVAVPVVLLVNAVDPAAWVTQTVYFAMIGLAGLAVAHYDHQQRRRADSARGSATS